LNNWSNEPMSTKPHDPSAAELASICLEIQATWTPDEAFKRLRADLRPMVRCADDRLLAVDAVDYQTLF